MSNKFKEVKLGVISDTHGKLKDIVKEVFQDVDYIFHAGDIGNNNNILSELGGIAPVYAVRGNCDAGYEIKHLPWEQKKEIAGIKIYMTHCYDCIDNATAKNSDLVIYGHSHRAEITKKGNTNYLNPGSASQKRSSKSCSVAVVRISQKGIDIEEVSI